jgi:hypothetical protein
MPGRRSIPIEKQSERSLRFALVVAPACCVPLGVGFSWAATSVGLTWKGVLCGFAGVWMFYMAAASVYSIRRELNRRRSAKEGDLNR